MEPKAYEDFAVRFEKDGRGGLLTRVLESPAGNGAAPFVPPFGSDGLADLLDRLGPAVKDRDAATREFRRSETAADGPAPGAIGILLYHALFSGRVGELWDESRGAVQRAGRGLRLKLRIDPRTPELAWVSSLPWELLRRTATEEFLNLDPDSPTVRFLEVPRASILPELQPPLRVLIALANPSGSTPLNLAEERKKLGEALACPGKVEPVFLQNATLEGLRKALRARPCHVVHFVGHGAFDERTGQGSLLFETGKGGRDLVCGPLLAEVLKTAAVPPLVVLNACDTARSACAEGLSPFAGVATALVLKGVSAVVAMQFPITDDAAVPFSAALYERIAAGDPVDTAVAEGRVAIRMALRTSMEWATPVLFLRAPDGRLFADGNEEGRPAGAKPPADPEPARAIVIRELRAKNANVIHGDVGKIENH